MYAPSTGRFNRLDPFQGDVKEPVSFNKYLYTHANPVNGSDPTGERNFLAELGKAAHLLISRLHQSQHRSHSVTYGKSIPSAGGAILPDIMDFSEGQIGEIKPLSASGIATGMVQLKAAIEIANGLEVTYKGVEIELPPVPHQGNQVEWVEEDWNPGVVVLYPGSIDSWFKQDLVVTLGNFEGLIIYKRVRLKQREKPSLVAPRIRQEIVHQLPELQIEIDGHMNQLKLKGFEVLTERLVFQYEFENRLLDSIVGSAILVTSAMRVSVGSILAIMGLKSATRGL